MASRLCKRCNQVRTANRVCAECAAATTCARCGAVHGRGAQAKYCDACLPMINVEVYHPKEKYRSHTPRMNWREAAYMGFQPTEMDWARLAAYIDGEGSIGLGVRRASKESYSETLMGKVIVTNTDQRLVQWCFETFGMNFYGKAIRPGKRAGREQNWKGCFYAQACSYKAAWVCLHCLPWFLLKREQAELVIANQKTTQVGLFKRGVAVKTPQDILEYRKSLKAKLNELNRRGPEVELPKAEGE
jgi:hypothetical protein